MQALAEDGEYDLVHPRSREKVALRAREVFDRMVRAAWETGDPGVVFLDRINAGAANPVPEMGPVEATNPCGEQPLYPNEACNLGSVNLARFVRPMPRGARRDGGVAAVRHRLGAVGAQCSAGHSLPRRRDHRQSVPRQWIDSAVKANRRVGLGVMGWADLLIDLEIPYDSEEALRLGAEIMRRLNDAGSRRVLPHCGRARPVPELAEEHLPGWSAPAQLHGDHDRTHGHDQHHRWLLVRHRADLRPSLRPQGLPGWRAEPGGVRPLHPGSQA